jgi:hypothetical protein
MISFNVTLLFWPCMITSVVCSILGLLNNNHRLLYIAAILIIPMSLYLSTWPRFLIIGLIFPLFNLGSAFYLRKQKRVVAIILNTPIYLVISWLGYIVLSQ